MAGWGRGEAVMGTPQMKSQIFNDNTVPDFNAVNCDNYRMGNTNPNTNPNPNPNQFYTI